MKNTAELVVEGRLLEDQLSDMRADYAKETVRDLCNAIEHLSRQQAGATEPLELLDLIRTQLVEEFGTEADWPTRIVTVWSHAYVLAHDYAAPSAPQAPPPADLKELLGRADRLETLVGLIGVGLQASDATSLRAEALRLLASRHANEKHGCHGGDGSTLPDSVTEALAAASRYEWSADSIVAVLRDEVIRLRAREQAVPEAGEVVCALVVSAADPHENYGYDKNVRVALNENCLNLEVGTHEVYAHDGRLYATPPSDPDVPAEGVDAGVLDRLRRWVSTQTRIAQDDRSANRRVATLVCLHSLTEFLDKESSDAR